MTKRIAYFLSYAASLQELVDNGTFVRLFKELCILSENFILDFYSKDSYIFLRHLMKKYKQPNINAQGILFSPYNIKKMPFAIHRIVSFLVLLQYYVLLPMLNFNKLKKADCFYIQHVSGGIAAIIYKSLFDSRKKIVSRYNWNWGNFIERSRNKFEQKLFRFLEKTVLNNSDIIFVGTETLKKNVEKIVHGKAKIIILPNWIDCDIFRQLNLKKDFDIISIGRLCPQKNHLLLLEAVNLYNIENQGNSLKILIIGNGELKVPLLRYAQEKNINLTLMEVVANDEMPYILNRSVISVMTSRYEGHPKAILEAMACGIAVVCTNVEGLRDIITDGENGLLCKEDAYDLKNKISFLLKNEDYKRKLGTNGIEYVRSHCSMHHILTVIKNELSS